jgi:hypothetical protein
MTSYVCKMRDGDGAMRCFVAFLDLTVDPFSAQVGFEGLYLD